MGTYYIERTSTVNPLTALEIKTLQQTDGGFRKLIFGQKDDSNPQRFYKTGELMLSQIIDPITNNVITPNHGVFSIPNTDLNGVCNTEYGARFLAGDSNTCVNEVDLKA